MGLILPDLLGPKLVRRLVKIRRELADDSDVGFCGTMGVIFCDPTYFLLQSLTKCLLKRMSRKKDSPRPSERCGRGDLHPAPAVLTSFLEGWLVWSLWLAALSRGDANPSCLSQLNGFMKQWRSTPFGSEATQAKRWLRCQPRSYLRLEAYSFFGLSEGA